MAGDERNGDWLQYRRSVLVALEALQKQQAAQEEAITKIRIEMAVLKTQMTLIMTAVSVTVSAIVAAIMQLVLK